MDSKRDRKLVRALRARDEDAFRELVSVYQHKVFNIIYRILNDRQEAEDVAQEVFITVFKHIDQFRGDAKFSTWLYRIATNHARNRIKYLSRRAKKKARRPRATWTSTRSGATWRARTNRRKPTSWK